MEEQEKERQRKRAESVRSMHVNGSPERNGDAGDGHGGGEGEEAGDVGSGSPPQGPGNGDAAVPFDPTEFGFPSIEAYEEGVSWTVLVAMGPTASCSFSCGCG